MSAIVVLLLIAFAWLFLQAGATFLGLLTLIIAILYAAGAAAAPKPPPALAAPTAVQQILPTAPYPTQPLEIRHRIQPYWAGALSGEDIIGRRIGGLLSFVAWNVRGVIDTIKSWAAPPPRR